MKMKNKIERKKENKDKKITKKMSFNEIMQKEPNAIPILLERGMHCIGCPMAMQETLEQGAVAHGLNPDKLEKEINDKLKKKEK